MYKNILRDSVLFTFFNPDYLSNNRNGWCVKPQQDPKGNQIVYCYIEDGIDNDNVRAVPPGSISRHADGHTYKANNLPWVRGQLPYCLPNRFGPKTYGCAYWLRMN